MKHTVIQNPPHRGQHITDISLHPAYLTDGPDGFVIWPTDCVPARVCFAVPASLSPLQTRSSTVAMASPPALWASARTAGGVMGLGYSRRTAEEGARSER